MSFTEQEENGKKDAQSNEELLKIIKTQSDQFNALQEQVKSLQEKQTSLGSAEVLAQALASFASKQKEKDLDYEAGIPEEEIPEGDFIKEGVRFCAPFVGYVISDDKRKGQRVILPYGKKIIEFDYTATRVTQSGKHQNSHPISAYISRSHKEVEWLRKHSLYGIMFYETTTEAANADAIKATRLATIMNHIKDYEMPDLMARAQENGVAINEDTSRMRMNLAFKILEKELEAEQLQVSKTLEENFRASVLAGK